MAKITSNLSIVRLCEDYQTSSKLNMWANIIKTLILLVAAAIIIFGVMMASKGMLAFGAIYVAVGVLHAFVAFFFVYIIRAFAIITEAATMIVLEHKEAEYYSKEAKIANIYSEEEMNREYSNNKQDSASEEPIVPLQPSKPAASASNNGSGWTSTPPARLRTGAKCRRRGDTKTMEIQDISMGRYTCMDPLTHKFLGDFKLEDLEFPV
jgi:membrane protein implicated in regulation of membrane protease activity